MEPKRILDLAANNDGTLDDPINLSSALLKELAEKVQTGIIRRTEDCRKWMRDTFENADAVRVVHGFVDRVRNMIHHVGGRTMTLPEALRHIDAREEQVRARMRLAEVRGECEESLQDTLGANIRTQMPELLAFLAHGETPKTDAARFADTLASQLAQLHDLHPQAFERISGILKIRCRELLNLYAKAYFGLDGLFSIMNAVSQSGAVDTVSMQLLGRDLKESTPQGLARDRLNQLKCFALATSQHVPAWRKTETAKGRRG